MTARFSSAKFTSYRETFLQPRIFFTHVINRLYGIHVQSKLITNDTSEIDEKNSTKILQYFWLIVRMNYAKDECDWRVKEKPKVQAAIENLPVIVTL